MTMIFFLWYNDTNNIEYTYKEKKYGSTTNY